MKIESTKKCVGDQVYHCAVPREDGYWDTICGATCGHEGVAYDPPEVFILHRFDAFQYYDWIDHTCPVCQTHPDLPLLVLGEL